MLFFHNFFTRWSISSPPWVRQRICRRSFRWISKSIPTIQATGPQSAGLVVPVCSIYAYMISTPTRSKYVQSQREKGQQWEPSSPRWRTVPRCVWIQKMFVDHWLLEFPGIRWHFNVEVPAVASDARLGHTSYTKGLLLVDASGASASRVLELTSEDCIWRTKTGDTAWRTVDQPQLLCLGSSNPRHQQTWTETDGQIQHWFVNKNTVIADESLKKWLNYNEQCKNMQENICFFAAFFVRKPGWHLGLDRRFIALKVTDQQVLEGSK